MCGRGVPPRLGGRGTEAPPAQIAAALEELLADTAALREARRFADVIAGLGRGEAAAREVVSLAGARAQARALFIA